MTKKIRTIADVNKDQAAEMEAALGPIVEKEAPAEDKKRDRRPIEIRLADAADYEGLTATDFATNPKLCKKHRIAHRLLTGAIIHKAAEHHCDRMSEMQATTKPKTDPLTDNKEELIVNTKKATKKAPQPEQPEVLVRETVRELIFSQYAPTAVLRYMGSEGWDIADAIRVIGQLATVAEATAKIQVRAGAKGERGEPAPLSEKEQAVLNKMRKAK